MTFTWPLGSIPASLQTARSALQIDWTGNAQGRAVSSQSVVPQSGVRARVSEISALHRSVANRILGGSTIYKNRHSQF